MNRNSKVISVKKSPTFSKRGMSLVELMITLSVLLIVIVAIGAFESNIFTYKNEVAGSFETAQKSQTLLKTMLAELREASPGANGAFPLVRTASSTISFFSDIDNDGKPEQITYSLIGTIMYKAVIKPTGSPLGYNPASQSTTTLNTAIVNGTLATFEYFDTNYNGTSSPLTQPVSPTQVRLVRINQKIDIDPLHAPMPIVYSVQVSFRNLKNNL